MQGDLSFPSGFPLFGAILQCIGVEPTVSLQLVSMIGFLLSGYWFYQLLLLWVPGAPMHTRVLYLCLFFSAPAMVKAGVVAMSDMLSLAFSLGATHAGLRSLETRRGAAWAALLAGLAILCRFAVAGWMIPLGIGVGCHLLKHRQWASIIGSVGVLCLILGLHIWIKAPTETINYSNHTLDGWSLVNLFKRSFSIADGHVNYSLPNGLWVLSVLCQPGLFILVPGLFFLFKRTDLLLPFRHIILACIISYSILLGGFPAQSLRLLLPLWSMVLLMMYPSFDRFICYGFYFAAKWTRLVLLAAALIQIIGISLQLRPIVWRAKQERLMAESIKKNVPDGAILYGIDYDVAMHNYLPWLQHRNLWEKQYPVFERGSYWVINPSKLAKQWANKNPMLNWTQANQQYRLIEVSSLPEGWALYKAEDY